MCHFSDAHYDDYSKASQHEFMSNWEAFRKHVPFPQSIQMVAPGVFGVGHITPTQENIKSLGGFRVFALRRELRSGLVSLWRFEAERTKRLFTLEDFLASRGRDYIETAKSLWGWEGRATPIRFEDLVNCSEGVSATIGRSLCVNPSFVQQNLAVSLDEPTRTESSGFLIGRPSKSNGHWSRRAEVLFNELGGSDANDLLGYA